MALLQLRQRHGHGTLRLNDGLLSELPSAGNRIEDVGEVNVIRVSVTRSALNGIRVMCVCPT